MLTEFSGFGLGSAVVARQRDMCQRLRDAAINTAAFGPLDSTRAAADTCRGGRKVGGMPSNRRDALLAEYREVSSNFRMLTDIRFKLLAFLPLAAGAAAAVLTRGNATTLTLAFSLFGLVVTIGLVTYNARNDQLYDTLVARAAAIERNLGIPDGAFANRPGPWFRPAHGSWKVDHRTAVSTIYKASIALWLFGALYAVIHLAQHTPSRWMNLIALVAAVGLTILGAWLVSREKEGARRRLRESAADAVNCAEKLGIAGLDDGDFRLLCKKLADQDADKIEARARFLSQLGPEPDAIAHYVTQGGSKWVAAQVVAVITDFAPEWLYDCASGRRRPI
jgi:hypothetical protein